MLSKTGLAIHPCHGMVCIEIPCIAFHSLKWIFIVENPDALAGEGIIIVIIIIIIVIIIII